MTVVHLILTDALYCNMSPPDLMSLKVAAEAGQWEAAYEVLKTRLHRVVVRVRPATIDQDVPDRTFTIKPEAATPRGAWPSVKVKHSMIESRFGNGGKGPAGAYLVAEVGELTAMLRAYGAMSDKAAADTLTRIAHIVTDSATPNEPSALLRWEEHAAEVYDEEEERR